MFRVNNIFEVIFLICFVVGTVIRKIYIARFRGTKTANKNKSMLDIFLISAAGVGMAAPLFYLFSPWLDFANYDLPRWTGWIGTAIFAGAILLLWKSHADLGRNWSATLRIKKEHSLITDGVYSHIRHPMYAAHLLWAIAQGLLLENWIAGWAFIVSSIPLYLVRVPQEEQMMIEHFGEEYLNYMSLTGSIIPRIWRRRHG